MGNNSSKNNNLFLFIIINFSLFIICLISYKFQNTVLWGDDYIFGIYSEGEKIFDCLIPNNPNSNFHGSYYLGLFLNKFLSYKLPVLLNIHPLEFVKYIHNPIKGFFIVLTLLSISNFSVIFKKSKILYLPVFIFLFGYFAKSIISTGIPEVGYNFYRYFFSLLFFSLFWYFILTNILLYKRKIKFFIILLIGISGYIIGTSIEINSLISIILASLIFLYCIFKEKKLKLNINFYIPLIGLLTGIILFTNTWGFKIVCTQRGLKNIIINSNIIKEYSKLFLNVCFENEYIYWIIFSILLIIAIYFGVKRKEIRKIIFPILLQISILIAMFSLILCGKTYYTTEYNYYLVHMNIQFLYKMLNLYSVLILMSYAIRSITKSLKDKRKADSLIILISLCFLTVGMINIFYFMNFKFDYMKEMKQRAYIFEKILRFYYLQEKVPQIPLEIIEKYTFNIDTEQCKFQTKYTDVYYPDIYKSEISKKKGFCANEDAISQYYKDGGIFNDYELEELNFSMLKYNDFVLNRKAEKSEIN